MCCPLKGASASLPITWKGTVYGSKEGGIPWSCQGERQGSKAPEPWHFWGAGSGAGGKRTGSGGADCSIPENCRLLLPSMVQHPAVVTIAEVVTVAGMSLQRTRANQHCVA